MQEIARFDQAQFRVPPAHQRLRADELRRLAPDIKLRLIINLKLHVLHGALEIKQKALVVGLSFQKLLIDDDRALLAHLARPAAGHTRKLQHAHGLCIRAPRRDPHFQPQTHIRREDVQAPLQAAIQPVIVLHRRTENGKAIRIHPAGNPAMFFYKALQSRSQRVQNIVLKALSAHDRDSRKLIDAHHDGVHRSVGLFPIHPFGIGVKVFPVVQSCTLVDLRLRNQAQAFVGSFFSTPPAQQQKQEHTAQQGKHTQQDDEIFPEQIDDGGVRILRIIFSQ